MAGNEVTSWCTYSARSPDPNLFPGRGMCLCVCVHAHLCMFFSLSPHFFFFFYFCKCTSWQLPDASHLHIHPTFTRICDAFGPPPPRNMHTPACACECDCVGFVFLSHLPPNLYYFLSIDSVREQFTRTLTRTLTDRCTRTHSLSLIDGRYESALDLEAFRLCLSWPPFFPLQSS